MSTEKSDFAAEQKRAHRLESKWTDEETAHELMEFLVEAGVRRDALLIGERTIEVDQGP